jgi:hypothetical protein
MALRFKLWNPIIDGNRMACCFDVTPNDTQLACGTQELMREFLSSLEIDAEPQEWRIDPFCSAYYASNTTAICHEDRHPMAWRVRVSFAEPCGEDTTPRVFTPVGVDAIDPTWDEQPNAWNWTSRVCVVIADFINAKWAELDQDFEREPVFLQCQGIDRVELALRMVQIRFDLGLVHFPDEEEQVVTLLRACEDRGASVNWASTLSGNIKKLWS